VSICSNLLEYECLDWIGLDWIGLNRTRADGDLCNAEEEDLNMWIAEREGERERERERESRGENENDSEAHLSLFEPTTAVTPTIQSSTTPKPPDPLHHPSSAIQLCLSFASP
jgi:hypothetical protein